MPDFEIIDFGNQGPPGPVASSVATAAAASAIDTTTWSTGAVVYVLSFKTFFVLDKTSALTADAVKILTATGGGRFVRDSSFVHPAWNARAAWYIDPVAGNDENDGSLATPLKTAVELARRFCGSLRPSVPRVDIYFLGTLSWSDPVDLTIIGTTAAENVVFHGSLTRVATASAITAVAAKSAVAGGMAMLLTGPNLTTNPKGVVRFTSGSCVGRDVRVGASPGANQVRVSTPLLNDYTNNLAPTASGGTPAPGDLYDVYVPTGGPQRMCLNVRNIALLGLVDMQLGDQQSDSPTHVVGMGDSVQLSTVNCTFLNFAPTGVLYQTHANPLWMQVHSNNGLTIFRDTFAQIFGGITKQGIVEARASATVSFENDALFENGAQIYALEGGTIICGSGMGILDPVAGTFYIDELSLFTAYGAVWSNTATQIATIAGRFGYANGALLLPGASTVLLNSKSAVRAYDESTGADVSSRSLTVTNLLATIASGGFAGSAWDRQSGARIYRV